MENHGTAGRATDDNMAQRIACWIPKATNTHSECRSTYCFSIATLIAQTRLIISLYAHCVSCSTWDDVCLLCGTNWVSNYSSGQFEQSGTQVFMWVIQSSPPSIISPAPRIRRRLSVAVPEQQKGKACEPSKVQCCFGNRRALDGRVNSLSSLNG